MKTKYTPRNKKVDNFVKSHNTWQNSQIQAHKQMYSTLDYFVKRCVIWQICQLFHSLLHTAESKLCNEDICIDQLLEEVSFVSNPSWTIFHGCFHNICIINRFSSNPKINKSLKISYAKSKKVKQTWLRHGEQQTRPIAYNTSKSYKWPPTRIDQDKDLHVWKPMAMTTILYLTSLKSRHN